MPGVQESIPHKHPTALYLCDNRSYSYSPIFAVNGNVKRRTVLYTAMLYFSEAYRLNICYAFAQKFCKNWPISFTIFVCLSVCLSVRM
jgi:hypothetical protein